MHVACCSASSRQRHSVKRTAATRTNTHTRTIAPAALAVRKPARLDRSKAAQRLMRVGSHAAPPIGRSSKAPLAGVYGCCASSAAMGPHVVCHMALPPARGRAHCFALPVTGVVCLFVRRSARRSPSQCSTRTADRSSLICGCADPPVQPALGVLWSTLPASAACARSTMEYSTRQCSLR